MECGGYNQNAHYHNRGGRCMTNSGMNYGRNCYGNTMQYKNTGCNMNRVDNSCRDKVYDNHDCDNKQKCNCIDKDKNYKGCDRGKEPVDSMMPAMSYVPWQQWEDIYCMEEALEKGTIFAQLNKPYVGRMTK